jgi:hypothetical protein
VTASDRFVVEKNADRDRGAWPWVIRDTRKGWITAKASTEATAHSTVDALNRDEAARSRAPPETSEHCPKTVSPRQPQAIDSA